MAFLDTVSNSQVVPTTELAGLDEEIRPQSVFLSLARRLPAPVVQGRFTLPPQISTAPDLSSSWLGEGETKPIADISFSRTSIRMRKIASILYRTEELQADSFIQIPARLRAAIVRAAAQAIDTALWNGTGGTDSDPLGLLQQSGNFLSATFGTASDLGGDLAEMNRQCRHNNIEPSAFVMRSHVLHALQLIEDGNNRPKYPEARGAAPSFMGVPITVSNNLGSISGPNTDNQYTSDVVLAAWQNVQCYVAPSSIRVSDVATLDDGGTSVNLWQQDMVAIRFVQHVSDVRAVYDNAVCVMSSVTV